MSYLKLKRLKIEKFRNVTPTELRFNNGFNVLLGQNGTGKTTLLKLAAMAISSKFPSLRHTEFAIEYEFEHPTIELRVSLSNRPSELEINPTTTLEKMPRIGSQSENMSWYYDINFKLKNNDIACNISASSSPPTSQNESSQKEPKHYTWKPNPFDSSFVFLAISAASREFEPEKRNLIFHGLLDLLASSCVRLDEGLGGFEAMTGMATAADSAEIGNAQISIQQTKGKTDGYGFTFFPIRLLDKIEILNGEGPTSVSIKDPDLGFLHKATQAMRFTAGELLLELQSKDVDNNTIKFVYGRFGYRFTLGDGSIIAQQSLSYGQKRLLTFLYYLAANDGVVIADELVNGLHYEWIETCLDEIGDRQSLLTSQNPLLLDFIPFETADEVERTFILCRAENRGDKNTMIWTNFSKADANSFYRAYEAGIQHVSDILRTKGLW